MKEKEKMNLQEATLKALYDQLDDSKDVDEVEGLVDNILVVTDPKINSEEYEEVIERAQEIVEDTPEGEIPFDEEWEGQYLQTCPICGATFVTDEILEPGAICPVCTQVPEAFVMVGRVETDEQVAKENNIDIENNEDEDEEEQPFVPETFEDEGEEEKIEASEQTKSADNKLEEEFIPNYSGLHCPKCDSNEYYEIDDEETEDGNQKFHYECSKCGYTSEKDEYSLEENKEVIEEEKIIEETIKPNQEDLRDLRNASDALQTLWDTIEGGESEYLGQYKGDIADASDIIDKILQKAELSSTEDLNISDEDLDNLIDELDESKETEISDTEVDAFDKQLEEAGITTTNKLYFVTGTPEDCHTVEEADEYYEILPRWDSTNYWRDKDNITQEQFELIDKNRKLAKEILKRAADNIRSYGPLD